MASRAAIVSLSTRSARASGCLASRLTSVGAAEQQPGLRAAEQLVAAGRDQVGPGTQPGPGIGLVGQQRMRGEQAGADVAHHGHAEPGQFGDAGAGP